MKLDSRLDWKLLRIPLFLILPVQALFLAAHGIDHGDAHPFAQLGLLVWSVVFAVHLKQLYVYRSTVNELVLALHHALLFWLLVALFAWEGAWLMKHAISEAATAWHAVPWAVIPAGLTWVLVWMGPRLQWPVAANLKWYLQYGALPPLIWSGLWSMAHAVFNAGHATPLPYIPILNPLELTITFVILVWIVWYRASKPLFERETMSFLSGVFRVAASAAGFLLLNGIIARTVHHYLGYDYTMNALWNAAEFQTAVSIAWTLLSLALMIVAHRHAHRNLWLLGAGLLSVVVVKLFFVELEKTGAVARVVSFMVVGVLMLVIGYFVPLPPRQPERTE